MDENAVDVEAATSGTLPTDLPVNDDVFNDDVIVIRGSGVSRILKVELNHTEFLQRLEKLNSDEMDRLLIEQDSLINFIPPDYDGLNFFQILCDKYNDKFNQVSWNTASKPEVKKKFMECFKVLFKHGISLTYEEPKYNDDVLDFSLYTYDKELIKLTLEQYKKKDISVANRDALTKVIYVYEEIIKHDPEDDESDSDSEDDEDVNDNNKGKPSKRFSRKSLNSTKIASFEECMRILQDCTNTLADILKMLLDHVIEPNQGVLINTLDFDTGVSPIYLAAKLRSKKIVNLFLEYEVDLDNYIDNDKETARILISKYKLNDKLPKKEEFKFHYYHKYILEKQCRDFIDMLYDENHEKIREEDFSKEEKYLFLLRAIQQGSSEIVKYMLNETKDINSRNFATMLRIACANGYFKTVKILFEEDDYNRVNTGTINYKFSLIKLLVEKGIGYKRNQIADPEVDYNKCLEFLLDNKNSYWNHTNLNKVMKNGKTILEYAIQYNQDTMVQILLRHNASLISPIDDPKKCCLALETDPQILQKHFNESIVIQKSDFYFNNKNTKKWKQKASVEKFKYSINYHSILPPRESKNIGISEMSLLEELSGDPDYNEVLMHPLCQIFTSLKWHRIRYFFQIDALIYMMYALLLSLYIYLDTTGFFLPVYILASLLVIWEFLQMQIFLRVYFVIFESWSKISLLALSWVMILMHNFGFESKTVLVQIHASLILLAYSNFFFLMGHLPKVPSNFLTSIIMLKTVYSSFIPSFLIYLPLFFAFITSFFTLFPDNDYFSSYPTAIFKTILMSTGEFDTDNLNFQNYAIAYPLMIFFVLFVAIGLLNLLTGLAVSDIQNIKNNSEIFSLKIKIHQIAKMEKISNGRWLKIFPFLKFISLFPDKNMRRVIKIDEKYANFFDKPNKKDPTVASTGAPTSVAQVKFTIPLSDKYLNILRMKRKMFRSKN